MSFRQDLKKKKYENGTLRSDEFWQDFSKYVRTKNKQVVNERTNIFNVKKCIRNRQVKSCKHCLHYAECYEGKPAYDKDGPLKEGEKKLGLSIIVAVIDDYKIAYRKGEKNKLKSLSLWLRSNEQVDILSMEQYDGVALEEGIARICLKHYGPFESIYQKRQAKLENEMKELNQDLKECNDPELKRVIKMKITICKGKMNA